MSKLNRNWRILNGQSVSGKALLTLAVLFVLSSGRAYATNYGYLEASGGTATIQGNGDIIFSSSTDGGASIYADNGAVVTVGSTSTTSGYDTITANGEVLAQDSSEVDLYADSAVLNRSTSGRAISSENGSAITVGSSDTSSITTTGEVIATDGSGSEASTITLTAGDITMNYDPNPYRSGGEDNTLYVDGGSTITLDASGTVTIEGPVGAVESGSSIIIDGSDISVTHNTVGTGNYTLETRGIYAESGGSIQIGSDDTDTLHVEVVNGSNRPVNDTLSSIQIRGNESSLAFYGKNIYLTTEDGIINGVDSDGGSLVIGSDATESITVDSPIATHGDGASTIINASKEITLGNVAANDDSFTQIGNTATESVSITGALWMFGGPEATVLGKSITIEADPDLVFNGAYSRASSSVSIGSDETNDVTITVAVTGDDSTLTILGNDITIGNGYASLNAYDGSQLVVGDTSTESAILDGWIAAEGGDIDDEAVSISVTADEITAKSAVLSMGSNSSVTLDGKDIFLTFTEESEDGISPMAPTYVSAEYGGSLTIGTSRTDTVYVADSVEAYCYPFDDGGSDIAPSTVTMDGASITVDKGVVADGMYATVTIGGAGVTQTLTSDLTAENYGVLVATLSGAYTGDVLAYGGPWEEEESYIVPGGTLTLTAGSATGNLTSTGAGSTLTATLSGALTGNATAEDSGELTLTVGTVTGNLATSESGVLTATVASLFNGMTTDDADTMTLNLNSGATWNLTDSSTVSALNADGAQVNLIDGTLGQTLTTDTFAGSGATVYLDADGSTNTGNDHLYVTGTHTGTTALHLSSTSNTWSGALGTVLASVGD